MRYKPRNAAALKIALGGLPNSLRVEVDPDVEVSAKTVGKLRMATNWPEKLAVTTPRERYPESVVKVSRASAPGRATPKP